MSSAELLFDGKDLAQWTEGNVLTWLDRVGHGSLKPLLVGHNVDGEVLPILTDSLMEEMGIGGPYTRSALLKAISTEVAKHSQAKKGQRNVPAGSSPRPSLEKAGKQATAGGARNLVDVYSEGATAEENDAIYSHANRHGFLDDHDDDEETGQSETEKVIEREKKWQKMMTGGKKKPLTLKALEKMPEFRRRVFKGIPYSWRIQVWKIFTVGELDQKKIDTYQEMLQKPTSEADVNQIDLDINRTMRDHVNYKQRYGKGQMRLFNVLRAYANYNPAIGFCQGMATVAAFLLIHCDEETTFWIMDTLVSGQRFELQGLWIAGFPTLMESFYVHDKLFKYHLPKLHKHFKAQNIHPSSYATRWYMTLFLSFPFHTCLRVWDIFLLEGYDVIFFLAIAALDYFQSELLGRDFEAIMEFMGQLQKVEMDDDKLIPLAVRVMRKTYSSLPGKSKALEVMRNEYKKVLAEGGSAFGDY